MYFALANGGPAAWFWSYIVVAFGALCQAATFAEMASIQPIAGAQYYWTWNFSPPKLRRFLTWIQGWATWTGYVALLASCLNGNTTLLEGMIQLAYPEFSSGGWHTTVINFATVGFCAVVNLYAFWLVPWFELLTGILNICLFVIFVVVLWVMSPRNSTEIFFQKNISTGWDNYFVSANIGALSSIFLFCCTYHHIGSPRTAGLQDIIASLSSVLTMFSPAFESVIHMGEETRDAKRAVPRAVFWSVVTNATLGLIMMITVGVRRETIHSISQNCGPFLANSNLGPDMHAIGPISSGLI